MALLFVFLQRLHQAAIDARRRAHTARYLGWATLSGLAVGLAVGCLLLVATSLWSVGLWLIAIILLAACLLPATAPLLIRHLLVPAGWVRAAHFAGRTGTVAGTDPAAYALVVAAWAVAGARRGAPDGAALAWVLAQRDARGKLGDAEVVATAFTLAPTDPGAARQLLSSVRELVEVHPAVRELAGEWLAVDAAERGAWDELLPAAPTPPTVPVDDEAPARSRDSASEPWACWPATPLRFFLEGVAARTLGHASAPSATGLAARWLLAPYRRRTWALLRAVHPPAPPTSQGASSGSNTSDHSDTTTGAASSVAGAPSADSAAGPGSSAPLREAIRQHLQVLAPASGPVADAAPAASPQALALGELISAWDRALTAPELAAWLATRSAALAAPAGAELRALAELEAQVVAQVRAHVERHRLPVPRLPASRFGQALAAHLRHGRLDALELAFERWSERVASGTRLPASDEWREFLTVRQAYRELAASGGADVRRLAFPRAFDAANRAAVALWNRRDEYVLAHAILHWQLEEARAVGDVAAIELAAKNSGLKVQTRTGPVTR